MFPALRVAATVLALSLALAGSLPAAHAEAKNGAATLVGKTVQVTYQNPNWNSERGVVQGVDATGALVEVKEQWVPSARAYQPMTPPETRYLPWSSIIALTLLRTP